MKKYLDKVNFERDSALRGFWIEVLDGSEDEIFLPDRILRQLHKALCPHRNTWQEWKKWERIVKERQRKFEMEVKKYKQLDPDRVVYLDSPIADIVAKSEQLAKRGLSSES